jgi:hypothetical protein
MLDTAQETVTLLKAREEYRTRMRVLYGDAVIAEADELAQAEGIEFEHAIFVLTIHHAFKHLHSETVVLMERIKAWLASPAVQSAVIAIDAAMKDAAFAIEERELFGTMEPTNRRERRAAKHSKCLKERDQVWKRRDYRNRRQN